MSKTVTLRGKQATEYLERLQGELAKVKDDVLFYGNGYLSADGKRIPPESVTMLETNKEPMSLDDIRENAGKPVVYEMPVEYLSLNKRVKELEGALRSLVERERAGLLMAGITKEGRVICQYCFYGNVPVSAMENFQHKADCPIEKGRSTLLHE